MIFTQNVIRLLLFGTVYLLVFIGIARAQHRNIVLPMGNLVLEYECGRPNLKTAPISRTIFNYNDNSIDTISGFVGCLELIDYKIIGDTVIALIVEWTSEIQYVYDLFHLKNNRWEHVGFCMLGQSVILLSSAEDSKIPAPIMQSWDKVSYSTNDQYKQSYLFSLTGQVEVTSDENGIITTKLYSIKPEDFFQK